MIVHEHMETMLFHARCRSEHGFGYPFFIEKNLRRLDNCGLLSKGFSRLRCKSCGYERLLAFSCKSKVCPSCQGRRMMDLSIHLVDQVLPRVPYRQWTLTFPRTIRFLMARDKKLLSKLFKMAMSTIFSWQRKQVKSEGFEQIYPGAVAFIQNTGSVLNLHYHSHSIVFDGVFAGNREEELVFIELTPSTKDVEEILKKIIRKVEQYLIRYQEGQVEDEPTVYHEKLAEVVQANQVSTSNELGHPKEENAATKTRCALLIGFSLHANTEAKARDRQGLARLIRYGSRFCVSEQQLSRLDNGDVCYFLKKPWGPHGITQVVKSPSEFLHRFAALIPPPYLNMTRYYGILAPNANRRHELCPERKQKAHTFSRPKLKAHARSSSQPLESNITYRLKTYADLTPMESLTPEGSCIKPNVQDLSPQASLEYPVRVGGRIPWAQLCQFTFSEDVKQCPQCGGTLTIIAAISMIQYELIEKVLRHLKLPVDFSEPSPAQYASQLDLDFDQDSSEEQDEVWGQDEDRAGDPRGPP